VKAPNRNRVETAKSMVRSWAEPAAERVRQMGPIGATPNLLAPQAALWLLDYLGELEAALAAQPQAGQHIPSAWVEELARELETRAARMLREGGAEGVASEIMLCAAKLRKRAKEGAP
jgi:hypothetical protein